MLPVNLRLSKAGACHTPSHAAIYSGRKRSAASLSALETSLETQLNPRPSFSACLATAACRCIVGASLSRATVASPPRWLPTHNILGTLSPLGLSTLTREPPRDACIFYLVGPWPISAVW